MTLGRSIRLLVAGLLFAAGARAAPPSVECETVRLLADRASGEVVKSMKLEDVLRAAGLHLISAGRADIEVNVETRGGDTRISAKGWTETEHTPLARVERGQKWSAYNRRYEWLPFDPARLAKASREAESALRAFRSSRSAGVAIGSDVQGALIVLTSPPRAQPPNARASAPTVLGCALTGTQLSGRVTSEGRHQSFALAAAKPPPPFTAELRQPGDAGPDGPRPVQANPVPIPPKPTWPLSRLTALLAAAFSLVMLALLLRRILRCRAFIAHASADKDVALRVGRLLEQRGFHAFVDAKGDDLPPGDEYDQRIRSSVARCDLFLLLMSQATADRRKYVWTEIRYAMKRFKQPARRVLPYLVDGGDRKAVLESLAKIEPWTTLNTVPEPQGDLVTEIANAAAEMRRWQAVRLGWWLAGSLATLALALAWQQRTSGCVMFWC